MVEISIVCLIYKSKQLAEALYDSLLEHTPMLKSGKAEFFFIANDPTKEVIEYLQKNSIPHYININEHLSEEELFSLGFGAPEYMRRVYQGYNLGILKANGQKVVLINSDNFFSRDWLENLLKYSDYKKIVSSKLVEPGQANFGVFPFATKKDFGRTLRDYNDDGFQKFAGKISKTGYTSGGAYMPCLFYRDIAVMVGLYPEGNIAGSEFNTVKRYGDEYFFDRLKEFGIEHITAMDSIVYHLKEGEKAELIDEETPYKSSITKSIKLNERLNVHPKDLIGYIAPESNHHSVINGLGRKVTALIINPQSETEIEESLQVINNFDFQNIETVLITDDKKYISIFRDRLKTIKVSKKKFDFALYDLFHKMYGEFLLVLNPSCHYETDLFKDVNERNFIYYFGNEIPDNNCLYDYMGNYLVPKNIIVDNIPTFLEFFLSKEKLIFDYSKFQLNDISRYKTALLELEEKANQKSLTKKIAAKYKEAGLKGLTSSVKNRISNR